MTHARDARLRTAILATAVAGVGYVLFWTVTTQVRDVRAVVPFGEDPYDLFASVAIVLLPLVGGLTAVRVLRYGPGGIPDGPVAARVRLGLAVCLALVSAAVAAAAVALAQAPMDAPDGMARLVTPGLALVAVALLAAWIALGRSLLVPATGERGRDETPEPDSLDDLMTVVPLPGAVRGPVERLAVWARQHRVAAGLCASLAAAAAAVAWHAIREGAWASPAAALVYGGILLVILLVAYGLLVGPLRVLRSA